MALPIAHPALRPQAPRNADLVGLGPLRLRFVDAALEDFGNRGGFTAVQPRSEDLFPGVTLISCLLLIAG